MSSILSILRTPPNSPRSFPFSLHSDQGDKRDWLELDSNPDQVHQETGTCHDISLRTRSGPPLAFDISIYVIAILYLVLQVIIFVAYVETFDWSTTTKSYRMSTQMVRPGPNFAVILLQIILTLPGMLRNNPIRRRLGYQVTGHYIWCLAATIIANLVVSLASMAWGDRRMGWDQREIVGGSTVVRT